jgi:hypothetical protein
MYSAMNQGRTPKSGAKPEEAPAAKSDETMLPYYGKRTIDRP